MTIWLFLSSILAPVLFWIGYFRYKDRFKPEPLVNMGISYIYGFCFAFLCFKIYSLFPMVGIPSDPSGLFDNHKILFLLYCIGAVGFLEELFKLLPFLMIIFCFKKFDERVDGIIYASIIALGFASFENLHYLLYLRGFSLFGRAIASPLTHTIFSAIWGYKIGIARLTKRNFQKSMITGLVMASLFHGLFDFLTLHSPLRFLSALLILILWIWRIKTIETLHKQQKSKVTTSMKTP